MYFIRKNIKYLITISFSLGLIVNFSLKEVYGESIVSDVTVEVIQDDSPTEIKEDNIQQNKLPQTNENSNYFFSWIGIGLIILWLSYRYRKLKF